MGYVNPYSWWGIYLLLQSKGYALWNIKKGGQLLFQKENDKGISRFEALSAVLASTVGLEIFLALPLQFIWVDQGY